MRCPYREYTIKTTGITNSKGEAVETERTGYEECYGKLCPYFRHFINGEFEEDYCERADKE